MTGTVENLCKAMAPWVARHSAVLRISTNAGGIDIGSATCIRVQDRFFLATARHNVADLPTKKKLAVSSAEGLIAPENFLDVLWFSYPKDESVDVACVELASHESESAGLEAMELSHMGPGVPLAKGNLYLAAGVPAATARFRNDDSGSTVVDLKFMCAVSEPFETSEPDSLRLNYAGKVVRSDGSITDHEPPNGMSGGGLWSVTQAQRAGIWTPGRRRLLGVL